MVTRVRIEAEGSTPNEVLKILQVAHERLTVEGPPSVLRTLYGDPLPSGAYPGLADAQAGECVIERFARDASEDPERTGHGVIVYKGRMTSHYAKPRKLMKLTGHSDLPMGPYVEDPDAEQPVIGRHTDPEVARHSQYEVTSTQGREGDPVDRVPAMNVSTDAELTYERLIATWNENVPPVQRPNIGPLRLFTVPGDMHVKAMLLWQTNEQLQVLYEKPIEHPNLSPRSWLVSPPAGEGG